jgi:hypothetical protein
MRAMSAMSRFLIRNLDAEDRPIFNQYRLSVLFNRLGGDFYGLFLCLHEGGKLTGALFVDTILLHGTIFPCLNVEEVLVVINSYLFYS